MPTASAWTASSSTMRIRPLGGIELAFSGTTVIPSVTAYVRFDTSVTDGTSTDQLRNGKDAFSPWPCDHGLLAMMSGIARYFCARRSAGGGSGAHTATRPRTLLPLNVSRALKAVRGRVSMTSPAGIDRIRARWLDGPALQVGDQG